MLIGRKSISEASAAIIHEQRSLRKEKILANPAFLVGFIGFVLIVILAVLVPVLDKTDPNAMEVAKRLQAPGGEYLFGTD